MRVMLLRHALTEGNLRGQYIGSSDMPLCEAGCGLANSIPPRSDVRRVYTSSLVRTMQTARVLYPNAQITPCEGLNEIDFGAFEQKGWRDLEYDPAYRAWVDSGCESACLGGERKADFTKRCVEAFLPIVSKAAASGADELHCVVHGGTIMAILSELAEPVRGYFEWPANFCGGYLLEYDGADTGGRPLRLIEAIRPREGSEKP